MDKKFIIERIKQVQKRLNMLISLTCLARVIIWLGGVAGIIFIIVIRFGLISPLNAWRIWVIMAAAGGFSGYLWSRAKHLKLYDTARWLDQKFNDHEALSAALVCLEHQNSEAFDQAILERANQLLKNQPRIEWPLRRGLTWLGGAALSVMIISTVFWFCIGDPRTVEVRPSQDLMKNVLHRNARQRGGENEIDETPKQMAERLFPHNAKMARRMEKALEKGDTAEMEKLLKDAKWDTDLMSNRETSPAEKPQAQADKEAMQQKMMEMARGITVDGQNKRKGKKTGTPTGNRQIAGDENGNSKESKQSTDSRKGKGSRFTPGENKNKEKVEGERRSQMANAGQGKKAQAGKGNHSVGKRWGNLDGGTGSQTALISSKKNSPMLEYVMPNKGARAPLVQAVPQAGRAAESAISKESLPSDYESFVRSYFLKLTKAANGGNGKKK